MRKCLSGFLLSVLTVTACFSQVKNVKHVIFIGVDGMGAYAVDRPANSTFRMMMKKGAYSLKAQSCLPSSSAPNWASHFMGASPAQHGYTKWNSKTPENPSSVTNEYGLFPTIFY
jgi:predicted AlkP superfamily phosphohydrolase/phosphomutase